MKDKLELYFQNKEINSIEEFFKLEKLEKLTTGLSLIVKIFDYLENNNNTNAIFNIITSISNYNIDVMQDEISEGLKILIRKKRISKCFRFLISHLNNNKNIDDYLIIEVITLISKQLNVAKDNKNDICSYDSYIDNLLLQVSCNSNSDEKEDKLSKQEIDSYVIDLFKAYTKNNKVKYNQLLWKTAITVFFKSDFTALKENTYNPKNTSNIKFNNADTSYLSLKHTTSFQILNLFPFTNGISEYIWKNILLEYDFLFCALFECLMDKCKNKKQTDDEKSISDTINNVIEIIPEVWKKNYGNNYNNEGSNNSLNYNFIKNMILSIDRMQLELKDSIIEDFFVWIINLYPDDFSKLNYFISVFRVSLSSNIIRKSISEYFRLNNIEAIYNIICLCKSKSINIPYETLNLDKSILQEVFLFMTNNTKINLNNSVSSELSAENSLYARSHFLIKDESNHSQRLIHKEDFNSSVKNNKNKNTTNVDVKEEGLNLCNKSNFITPIINNNIGDISNEDNLSNEIIDINEIRSSDNNLINVVNKDKSEEVMEAVVNINEIKDY